MRRAVRLRRTLLATILLGFALPSAAQPIPRSRLLEAERSLLAEWQRAEPDLLEFARREGFALRERRRRAQLLEAALSGAHGAPALQTARALRSLELELSDHALLDPYQYILDFRDGSNRVEVRPGTALDLRDSYQVSLWLYLEGGARAWETKLFTHADVNRNKFNIMLEGRFVELLLTGEDGEFLRFRSDGEIPLRRWTHLVVGYDAGRGAGMWVDGEAMAQRQTLGEPRFQRLCSDPERPLFLGCLDRCLPGSMDEVRVYDRPLGESDVRALAAGRDLREGLVARWPMDAAAGPARNPIDVRLQGTVGASVRRDLAGAPLLGGQAFGFSGKAAAWSDRLQQLESELDSLELELLEQVETALEDAILPPAPVPLVVYLPGRPLAFVHHDTLDEPLRVALAEQPLPDWLSELSRRHRRRDDRAWREVARALAVALWDPVAEAMAAAGLADDEIWLSLPESLRSLPFSALIDLQGRYLQETVAFARIGPILSLRPEMPRPQGEVLLIGNPDFRAARGKNSEQPWKREGSGDVDRLGRCWVMGELLYGSHRELELLSERFASRQSQRLEWLDAYVAVLQQSMPGSGIIHIATHGYLLDAECAPRLPLERMEWSGLKLGGSDILRGDHIEHEDRGYLSAAGLSRLDLHATNLIFFSGCETAAQGASSLAAAAWLAGARCSVGTLAPIDDGLTPVVSEHFYAQWLDGDSPAQALRKAREALRQHLLRTRGRAHPSAWAPFVLEGL